MSRRVLKNSVLYFVGGNLVNVLNYGFHIVTSRFLNAEEYGALSSLLALFFILSVPSITFQTVVTRQFSDHQEEDRYEYMLFVLVQMILVGVGVAVVFFAVSPYLASFLHIGDLGWFWIMSVTFGVTFLLSAYRGYFQSRERFGMLSVNMNCEALLKLVLFGVFFALGLRVEGAMWALLLSIVLTIVFFFPTIPFRLEHIGGRLWKKFQSSFWHETNMIFWSILCMTLFYNVDMILVRHFFPAQAGEYSIVSKFGQLLFFGGNLLVSVFFSHMVQSKGKEKDYASGMLMGFLLMFCVAVNAVYFLFGEELVMMLFGNQYVGAGPYLWMYGVAIAFLSCTNLISHYFLAHKWYSFLWWMGGVVISYTVTMWVWNDDLVSILWGIGINQLVLLVGMVVLLVWRKSTVRFVLADTKKNGEI